MSINPFLESSMRRRGPIPFATFTCSQLLRNPSEDEAENLVTTFAGYISGCVGARGLISGRQSLCNNEIEAIRTIRAALTVGQFDHMADRLTQIFSRFDSSNQLSTTHRLSTTKPSSISHC